MKQNQRLETAGPGRSASTEQGASSSGPGRPARVGVVHRKPRVSGWSGSLQRSLRQNMHHVLTAVLLVLGLGLIAVLVHLVGNGGHWTAPPNRFDQLLGASNTPPPTPPTADPKP